MLADRLGMSLDRVKMETSVSQFVLWMEYIKWEMSNGFHREDYLAAILAVETRRSYVKDPNKVKASDFPLPLKFKKQESQHLTIQERTMRAKQFAFGIAGLLGKGKKFLKKGK